LNIVIITQDEPFYLGKPFSSFLDSLKLNHNIVGCVLLAASPFGKRESFFTKAIRTLKVFGPSFFLYYGLLYIVSKVFKKNSISKILASHSIPIINLDSSINSDRSIKKIKSLGADLSVSILGNEIFKKPFLDLCPCLNLHTAPLPKYRGLMPTFWVLKNLEKETAVSIFLVDEGIDSGPILVQRPVVIDNPKQSELIRKTKKIGLDAMLEAIDLMEIGNPKLIENNAADATYFGFPGRADVKDFFRVGGKFF